MGRGKIKVSVTCAGVKFLECWNVQQTQPEIILDLDVEERRLSNTFKCLSTKLKSLVNIFLYPGPVELDQSWVKWKFKPKVENFLFAKSYLRLSHAGKSVTWTLSLLNHEDINIVNGNQHHLQIQPPSSTEESWSSQVAITGILF